MTARGSAALYTPEILALAVELADYPITDGLSAHGDAHSRVCGSRVTLAMSTDDDDRIAAIGARVSACAIGQAAAALFLKSAIGYDAPAITVARDEIEAWLSGDEAAPFWPRIAAIASARAYPARHAAILLPWNAACAALSKSIVAD